MKRQLKVKEDKKRRHDIIFRNTRVRSHCDFKQLLSKQPIDISLGLERLDGQVFITFFIGEIKQLFAIGHLAEKWVLKVGINSVSLTKVALSMLGEESNELLF